MTAAHRTATAIKFARIITATTAAGWSVQGSSTTDLYLTRTNNADQPVDVTITADMSHFTLTVKLGSASATALRQTASQVIAALAS